MPQQHERAFVASSDPSCISGHQVIWPGAGYGAMSSSSVCQNPVYDSWLKEFNPSSKGLSPTLSEISQKRFQCTSNETRVAPWPALSAYQAVEPAIIRPQPRNIPLCGYLAEEAAVPNVSKVTEKSKEPGVFRLFGVDLMKHTGASTPDVAIAGAGETSIRVAGSFVESGQLSAFSKVTKTVNESPREIQSNQSHIARNRVKVQHFLSLSNPSAFDCKLLSNVMFGLH
jgi:hypothetical protein